MNMVNRWQPASDEIDALRRAGEYFGRQALTAKPVLMSRLLGDLLPDEQEIRKLWDGAMLQPGTGDVPVQRDFLQKQLSAMPQSADTYETQKLLTAVGIMLGWEDVLEMTVPEQARTDVRQSAPYESAGMNRDMASSNGRTQHVREEMPSSMRSESVQEQVPPWMQKKQSQPAAAQEPMILASIASVNMEEITAGFSNKSVSGMLAVRSDGIALYKHKTAGYIGAAMAGALTMGVGMRAMMKHVNVEETPSFFLPAAEIHSISRKYLLGVYDLVLVMNNGRRFRVNCTALNSDKNQVEAAASAVEELLAKR